MALVLNNTCVGTKTLDCGLIESKFKLYLCYYIHIKTNTFGKGLNPQPIMD